MHFTNEQINKARQANSVEELFEIANQNGVKLTKEQAQYYFNELNKEGELSDEELLAVTGGKGEPPTPKFQVGDYVDTYYGPGYIYYMEYIDRFDEWYYNVGVGSAEGRLLKESEISLRDK